METLGLTIQIIIILFILATPIILVVNGHRFLRVNIISIPLIFVLVTLAAYWPHFYTDLRLELMGFYFEGMSDAERAKDVAPELKEVATKLYWSNMGIGWPLQAIIGMVFFGPYPSLIWLFGVLANYCRTRLGN